MNLEALKDGFTQNKYALANFKTAIDENLIDLYAHLSDDISKNFEQTQEFLEQQLTFLEGRLNIQFNELKIQLS